MEERPLATIATDKPRFCAYVAIFAIDLWSKKLHSIKRYGLWGLKSNFFLSQVTNPLISCIWKTKLILSPFVQKLNKTLWERLFGHGRTTGMILWTCLIAAKQLSSYLTREDKSFTPLFAEPLSLYSMSQSTTKIVSFHDNVWKYVHLQCRNAWSQHRT